MTDVAAPPEDAATSRALTVTEFATRLTRHLGALSAFEIEGEVIGLKDRNGHRSFALRDATSRVSAFVYASLVAQLPFELVEGLFVRGRARVSYFGPHGQVQVTFETLVPRDEGPLQLALRQLTARLEAEGLFAPERKKPLPRFPVTVGVVTSKTGAVFRDIQQTIQRRWPGLTIQLYAVRVQGEDAAAEIAGAIRAFDRAGEADVILVGRGGGSAEDLWAFNEEIVARAIAESSIPIVSCVGHANDQTLADAVSDRSAPTPTAAAELVTPVTLEDVQALVASFERRAGSLLRRRVEGPRIRIATLLGRRVFREPSLLTKQNRERVDDVARGLVDAVTANREDAADVVDRARLRLHSANPLALLERGFAVVERASDRAVVRDPAEVATGDRVRIRVHGGEFDGEVL